MKVQFENAEVFIDLRKVVLIHLARCVNVDHLRTARIYFADGAEYGNDLSCKKAVELVEAWEKQRKGVKGA